MSTILKLLPLELAELDNKDLVDPELKPARGEKLLGTLSLEEQKMYSLMVRSLATLEHMKADMLLASTPQAIRDLRRMISRVEVLRVLFWDMVNNNHETWHMSVGVRAGFKLVELRGSASPDFGDFLGHLFRMSRGEEESE